MKKVVIFLLFAYCFLFLISVSYSESETAAFIKRGIGARAAALGNTQVGLADTADAVYWNPSGLVQLKQNQLSLMHMELFIEDISLDYGGFAYPISDKDVVGFGWIMAKTEDNHITTHFYDTQYITFSTKDVLNNIGEYVYKNLQYHDPVGYMENKENAYFIAYARDLSNGNKKAYAGLAVKFITNDGLKGVNYDKPKAIKDLEAAGITITGVKSPTFDGRAQDLATIGKVWGEPGDEQNADGYSVDIGMLYIPRDDFRFGVNIQNALGTRLKWSTGRKEKFPLVIKAGIVHKTNFAKIFKKAKETKNDLLLLMDINKEEERDATFHFGSEYSLTDAIKVRLGLDEGRFTCGIGINVENIILDYAYSEHRLTDLSRISLSYSF